MSSSTKHAEDRLTNFFLGDSVMAGLMRATQWSKSPLGPPEAWPRGLKTVVRIVLTSRSAMCLCWGPELTFFFNDAYKPILGVKHAWALGSRADKVWGEIWPDISARIETVLRTGTAALDERRLLFLERNDFREETYHTSSYSPVADDNGMVVGVLCVATEETDRVIGERRLAVLRELAATLATTKTEKDVVAAVRARLTRNRHDLPCALLYLYNQDRGVARLACSPGVPEGHPAAPATIALDAPDTPWPAAQVLSRPASVFIDDGSSLFQGMPGDPWEKPPHQAVVVPIAKQGQGQPAGFLVAGLNPFRRYDVDCESFLGLVAGQIASGLANARAHKAASALHQSEERYRAFVNASSDVVYCMSPDWSEMRYLEGREFIPDTHKPSRDWPQKYIHPDDQPRVKEVIHKAVGTKSVFELEHRVVRVDGTLGWTFSRAVPILDAQGEIIEWFGAASDVTRRRQAEEERERLLRVAQAAREAAEAANRMKDEFLATLSHELRTPLNAILGWAKILRSGKLDSDDIRKGVEVIERNSRAQAQLIEDLLDISRIISGKLTLEVQRVRLQDVIEAAIASVMPAANAKEIRIHQMLDTLAGPVAGDPNRLQQVVWNLLSNAVKFTPRGGKVQVLLERVNSHLEVSVIDTGEGIKPDFLPYVFERFRQADPSTTKRHGGLGLGLSIVKQLVEMHGGGVRAKSAGGGRGATFVVALPISVVHPEPEKARRSETGETEAASKAGLLAGLRVLVVDDEPDGRQLMKRVLADCQADVSLAGSASEAFQLILLKKPDILISDIGMPGEDGYDLIRKVRARHGAKELPAAALTAFARSTDRRRAMLAGFQTHVAKPVDPDELIAVVASLAGKTGGQSI